MKTEVDLSCTYMGLKLKSPLIVGSCGLTNDVDKIRKMEACGAGAVVLKSIFEEQIMVDTNHSIQQMQEEYLHPDAMDYIKNYTEIAFYEKYTSLINNVKKVVNIPVIASIHCITDGDWASYAKRMQEAGADAIELNISLLPVDLDKSSKAYEETYVRIINHVKENISIPLAVKISPYFSSLIKTLQSFHYSGADALVLFNRFYEPDIDIDEMKITGAGIKQESVNFHSVLRWISIMNNYVDCNLSASSGVSSGAHIVKQLLAGADTIQAVTVFYQKGIEYMTTMLEDVKTWMQKHNYSYITDFKGELSYKQINDPNAYLRIQFMKYFAGIE